MILSLRSTGGFFMPITLTIVVPYFFQLFLTALKLNEI